MDGRAWLRELAGRLRSAGIECVVGTGFLAFMGPATRMSTVLAWTSRGVTLCHAMPLRSRPRSARALARLLQRFSRESGLEFTVTPARYVCAVSRLSVGDAPLAVDTLLAAADELRHQVGAREKAVRAALEQVDAAHHLHAAYAE